MCQQVHLQDRTLITDTVYPRGMAKVRIQIKRRKHFSPLISKNKIKIYKSKYKRVWGYEHLYMFLADKLIAIVMESNLAVSNRYMHHQQSYFCETILQQKNQYLRLFIQLYLLKDC